MKYNVSKHVEHATAKTKSHCLEVVRTLVQTWGQEYTGEQSKTDYSGANPRKWRSLDKGK